jgi:hypothetical protein
MHLQGAIELVVVILIALFVFRPKRKSLIHPVSASDSALLRRFRLFHNGFAKLGL